MDKLSFANQLFERDNILTNSYDLILSTLKDNYNNIEEEDFKNELVKSLKNSVKKLAHADNSNELQKQVLSQILNENFDDINSLNKVKF